MDKFRDNIIMAALLYNCIVNEELNIKYSDMNLYIEKVNKILEENNFDFWTFNNTSQFFSYYVTNNIVSDKLFCLSDDDKLDIKYKLYIEKLPMPIITATLNEEALAIIGVDKEKLKLKNVTETFNHVENVVTFSSEEAKKIVNNNLAAKGIDQIKASCTHPTMLADGFGYRVHVVYSKEYECLDHNIFNKYNQKRLILKK